MRCSEGGRVFLAGNSIERSERIKEMSIERVKAYFEKYGMENKKIKGGLQ